MQLCCPYDEKIKKYIAFKTQKIYVIMRLLLGVSLQTYRVSYLRIF